jgi:hypothetical protein
MRFTIPFSTRNNNNNGIIADKNQFHLFKDDRGHLYSRALLESQHQFKKGQVFHSYTQGKLFHIFLSFLLLARVYSLVLVLVCTANVEEGMKLADRR